MSIIKSLYRKFLKLVLYVKYLDIVKSVLWMTKLRFLYSFSFLVYPSSIVDISKTANVIINEGRLVINASWFNVRSRRYTSELRICGGEN